MYIYKQHFDAHAGNLHDALAQQKAEQVFGNTLQHAATHKKQNVPGLLPDTLQHIATHGSTLQHTQNNM